MNEGRRLMLLGAAGAVAGLAGCAGSPAPIDWFSLVPSGAPSPAPGGTPPGATLLVGLVTLPQEVDRPQLVRHGTDGRPGLLELQRWSEPLKAQLPRALALALAPRLPQVLVVAAPSAAVARPDWRLSVDVQRFELRVDGANRAVLHAVWSAGTLLPQAEAVEVGATSGAPEALAAAMAQALQQLAGRIADGLRKAPAFPR